MESYLGEWLNLLLRWFHVIAAIAWIGESFYFVMLDLSLEVPKDAASRARGVFGELWAVHGGGFYNSQKYLVSPPQMPEHLHWSKWKSYATWLSGFALFTVLYLAQPRTYLIDPSVLEIGSGEAIGFALGFLLLGWFVYDALCHMLAEREGLLGAILAVLVVLAAWCTTHIFSGRAAFLITGATLATIMTANVFFVIIPGQRLMVASLARGEVPDPLPGKLGRQRSVHNTYFTLPVVFAMISNHYALTYAGRDNWVVLSVLMLSGALVRQFFVLRHGGRSVWTLPVGSAVLVAGLVIWMSPRELGSGAVAAADAGGTPVTLADIRPIIVQRCEVCHSAHPTLMESAPQGVMFDTPQEIETNAARIYQQAVRLKVMPLGNVTGITEAERVRLGQWVQDRGVH